jgi:hypothetical protein
MEILEKNITEYAKRAFSEHFAEVKVFNGRTIIEGIERPSMTIWYNSKIIEIEGFSLSDVLYKLEQIINLIGAIKCTK